MNKILKLCQKHGETLHYQYNRKARPGAGYKCCKCNVENVARKRQSLKIKAIQYLGGKCIHCGLEDECPVVYDFHHKDSSKKDFGISASGHTRSWEKLKIELDKCILLCANCHRREHYRIKNTTNQM